MDEAGYTFGSYFQEIPGTVFFKWMRKPMNWNKYHHFSAFKRHAAEGTLPNYVFIDPRYFDIPGAPANDDHPSHDVSEGQRLMKEVYEAIRNSPQWEESLLIITYDEHGGFYDHHPTPLADIPNPDGKNSIIPYVFDFERLGVRVPTVMVSPWINKGTVVHGPPEEQKPAPNSEYDHSSVHATLKKMFGLKNFLTKRDAWSGTFEHIFNRTTVRTDCPTEIEGPKKSFRHFPLNGLAPLSELQEEFVMLAGSLNGEVNINTKKMNVLQGSNYIKKQVVKFFGRDIYEGTEDDIRPDVDV
jgi:phospholipase C